MAKKDTKENFFTGDEYEYPGVEDAWKCDSCNQLIYYLSPENGHLYPVPGAPVPRFIDLTYKKVCSLCLFMYNVVNDSDYFRTLSQNAVQAKKAKQKEWEGMS